MKPWQVTISNKDFETYLVDAGSAEEANKKITDALDNGSLWNDGLKKIEPYTSGSGDYWEIEHENAKKAAKLGGLFRQRLVKLVIVLLFP